MNKQMVCLRVLLHTCYLLSVFGLVATSEEQDTPLRGIDVLIFEQEDTINAVFLQSRNVYEQLNLTNEAPLEYEIFLSRYLARKPLSRSLSIVFIGERAHTVQQLYQVLSCCVCKDRCFDNFPVRHGGDDILDFHVEGEHGVSPRRYSEGQLSNWTMFTMLP